jgi:HopA1 effector protein family
MNRSRLYADLELIEAAVKIFRINEYEICGTKRLFGAGDGVDRSTELLKYNLQRDVYRHLYSRCPVGQQDYNPTYVDREFVERLSTANSGNGTWEPGWSVLEQTEDDRYAVSKGKVKFWVYRSGMRSDADQPKVGASCQVWIGKEKRYLVPGFYYFVGNETADIVDYTASNSDILRIYWNIELAGADVWVRSVSEILNTSRIPFNAKIPSNPDSYFRADAGVIYVSNKYINSLLSPIASIRRAVLRYLRSPVPLFTFEIAPGIGLAEDPGGGVSFGQTRCEFVVDGLVRSFFEGDEISKDRISKMESIFITASINPDRPYLNPLSKNDFSMLSLQRIER